MVIYPLYDTKVRIVTVPEVVKVEGTTPSQAPDRTRPPRQVPSLGGKRRHRLPIFVYTRLQKTLATIQKQLGGAIARLFSKYGFEIHDGACEVATAVSREPCLIVRDPCRAFAG